ncbi:MAG: RHS repeat-associated core domain-containing protein [Clostridia bacterium]|nr:RHS repeat-associated core domain-containing protein [Clostridia bacterium]
MYGEASYDDSGSLLAQQTSASGGTTTYNYNGNAYQLTSKITDPNGGSTHYQYYTMGQTKKVICGSTNVVYAYSNDWLGTITVSNTITYDFSKDAFSRPTMTKMNDLLLAQTTYDAYGRVSSHKDAANKTDSYSYDALDRISQITYNGNTLKYYYGSNGKLAQATDSIADTRTKYVYDFAGRLVSERTYTGTALDVSNLQSALDYTYTNGTNQLSAIKTKSTLGTNTLGITYGDLTDAKSAGYIYSESWNGAVAKRYTYDDFGRIASNRTQTTATSLNTIYTYKNLTAWRTTPLVESLQTPAATYTYTYDNNGNILSESDGLYTTSYEYYANNMLKRENNQRAGYTRTYTYVDANISTVKTYAYTTGALGTALSTNVYAYDPNCMDLLTSARGKNIYYTGVMPNTYDGHAVTWARSGLMSAYDSGTDSHSYTYDVSGRRLEKEDNGVTTEFIYAGDLLLGQKTGTNSLVFKFDSNGDYFGFTYNGTPYYYVKNLQGDVVAIANNAGTIVARYYYDAWGKLLSYTDTSGANIATVNPIRYRSYYYDTETGFYFLQSRYYDPEIGRFISPDDPDTLGASPNDVTDKNLFAYCDNNPVSRVDTGGEFWNTCIGAIAGAITGGIFAAIEGDNVWAGIGIGFATGAIAGFGIDLALATGGIGAIAIAGAFGALASGGNTALNDTANKRDINWGQALGDAVIGGAFNVLSLGLAGGPGKKTGGKIITKMIENAKKELFSNTTRKVAGVVVSKSASGVRKNIIKNIVFATSNSTIINNGSWFISKIIRGATR